MNRSTLSSIWPVFLMSIGMIACQMEASESPGSGQEVLPYFQEATFTPYWLLPTDLKQDSFHQIPPFTFTNQEGKTITEQSFAGKIYVADFFFTTCPGICPKMTDNMRALQEVFMEDEEVMLLSHSVMPDHDSVTVLHQYAQKKGIVAGKWHLVTGDQAEIYRLGRQAYFVEEDLGLRKDPDEFLHTENFVLIDRERHIRGIYDGLSKASVRQLVADIHTLKQENRGSLPEVPQSR